MVLALTSCATDKPSSSPTRETITITETPAPAVDQPVAAPAVTPIIGSVMAAPFPVAASDGRTHLAYELLLTNVLSQDVTVMSMGVVAKDKPILSLAGAELADRTRALGSSAPTTTLGPAQSAIVYLDVILDAAAPVPSDLNHIIGISVPQPRPPVIEGAMTEMIAPTKVDNRKPATISPPLHGANWVDGDGCCGLSAHRTAGNPLNGQIYFAERYAIDYVQLMSDGRMFTGDKSQLTSYPYYGTDVLAVADGPVVAVVDGLPEQVPGVGPEGLPLDQYPGNHVIQDIGGGNFVMYAHLKTGSVKPKTGDRLTAGQTLGSLGNSGNSDAPHLHFQLMNTPEPLRSSGLPFVLDDFRLTGRLQSVASLEESGVADMAPGVVPQDEKFAMPLDLDVMDYR